VNRSGHKVKDGQRLCVFVCIYISLLSVLTPQNGSWLGLWIWK